MARIHVAIRLLFVVALGSIGCSSVYWVLYLALPAVAAALIAQEGGAQYLANEGPRLLRVLRWLAGAYGYVWLLTDATPSMEPGGPVQLELELRFGRAPTATSALLRVVYSLPALLVLAVLSMVACLLWVIGALSVLVSERVPSWVASFLEMTLRYQFRLFAYHLALTSAYPSLEGEAPVTVSPTGLSGGAHASR
jgi:hypothetical protein